MQFSNIPLMQLICIVSIAIRCEGRAIETRYDPEETHETKASRAYLDVGDFTLYSNEESKQEGDRSERSLLKISENEDPKKLTKIVRLERSPAYSPFGRAEGEASAPRRRARSPAYSPFGRAEGEASAPRRRARSPAYSPFGRAEGEASAPRKGTGSPLDTSEEAHESIQGTHLVREERSPAYSPFGRAEGEASAPRRRA